MVAYGTEKPQAYRLRLIDERMRRLLPTLFDVFRYDKTLVVERQFDNCSRKDCL